MAKKTTRGPLTALFTVRIWGTTFISTKVLLDDFQPVEILFFRFVMGYMALFAAAPRWLKGPDWKQEVLFAAAGLCGVSLYYLLENIALTYTMTANVSVIVSTAPFFTVILDRLLVDRGQKLRANFLLGFAFAIGGIALISFQGSGVEINPMGDLLSLLAAVIWACYSLLIRKIGTFGYPVVLATRRMFFYGILFMVPALSFFEFHLDFPRFANSIYLLNFLYLGLGASAVCFASWNYAVEMLGPVKTSVYIYLVPVITVITSFLILGEKVTLMSGAGVALVLAGLFISEYKKKKKE